MAGVARSRAGLPPGRLLAGVVAVELLALVGYAVLTPGTVLEPRYALYPFVWINAGILGVAVTDPPTGSARARSLAVAVAVGYFLVLCLLAGLLSFSDASHVPPGLHASMAAPGWGPRVALVGDGWHLYFVPYRVVGYLALAYLAYAALLDAAVTVASGVVGLVSCASCTFPVVAGLAAGLVGGTGGMVAALVPLSMDLATLVFVATVALFVWRPAQRME